MRPQERDAPDDRRHARPPRSCPLCGSTDSEALVIGYDRMVARDGAFLYRRCTNCRLVAQDPLPTADEVLGFYPDGYEPHGTATTLADKRRRWINRLAISCFYDVRSFSRPRAVRAIFRALAGRILPNTLEPHGRNRLLDVGCGSGDLLARHRDLGWQVRGIEPHGQGRAAAVRRGLDVFPGTLLDPGFDDAPFDVVLMSHVIEHVPDPVAYLRRAAELLAPNGKIVVVTPNIRSCGFQIYGSCWYPLDAPRHLMLLDPDTLRRLATQAGLRARMVRTVGAARLWCESRHYARTQGLALPAEVGARRQLLEESARRKPAYREFRRLVRPIAFACALLGRGDLMEAEISRG